MLHAALLRKRPGQEVTREKSHARCPGFMGGSVGSSRGQERVPAGQWGGGLEEGLVLPVKVCSSAPAGNQYLANKVIFFKKMMLCHSFQQ